MLLIIPHTCYNATYATYDFAYMPRTLPSGSIILRSCCKPRSAAGTIVGKGFWSVWSSYLVRTLDQIHPKEHWRNGGNKHWEKSICKEYLFKFFSHNTTHYLFLFEGQEAGSVVRISIDQNSKQCEELLMLAWLSKSKCTSGAGGVTTDCDLPWCPFFASAEIDCCGSYRDLPKIPGAEIS